MKYITV